MKVLSIESGSPYPDYSNKSTFSWVQAILKAQEACKVKLSCFKGIVHPTHQRVTGIPVPGNSRENQLNFFPLDLEKSFSISRSRLETRD